MANDSPQTKDGSSEAPRVVSSYKNLRENIHGLEPGGWLLWDCARIVLWVSIIGGVLFIFTGLATPFVAVSSGSMEPNIQTGDLVVVVAVDSSDQKPLVGDRSITTVENSTQNDVTYRSFGGPGDVIVFDQQGTGPPIIHRAHFRVSEGENWVAGADEGYLGEVENCHEVSTCPAPHDGYITAGDHNNEYDQVRNHDPVTDEQIIAVAKYRIPWLGWIRIGIDAILP